MNRQKNVLHSGRTALGWCVALSLVAALPGTALADEPVAKGAGKDAAATTITVQGNKIPEGKHCLYMNLATVPVNTSDKLLSITAGINGQATLMSLDTGTLHSQLTDAEAEKLGVQLLHAKQTVKGVNGEVEAMHAAFLNDVALDQFFWHRVTVGVVPQIPESYDAKVGADILLNGLNKDIEIALANKQIKVFVPADCSNQFLAYWDDHAFVVPLTDLSLSDPRQVVTVQINGHEIIAMIDSGAPHSIIDIEAAARLGITPNSAGVTEWQHTDKIGKAMGATWLAPVDSFTIGDETIRNTKIGIADLWGPAPIEAPFKAAMRLKSLEPPLPGGDKAISVQSGMGRIAQLSSAISETVHPDMLLGADFLKTHRVLLAMSQRRLYFTYLGGKVFEQDDMKKTAELVQPADDLASADGASH